MERFETVSTSPYTATSTPILLRETSTTRLFFCPVIVTNDKHPKACVDGAFVFEKKGKNDAWEPAERVSLATVKKDERFKLELHAAELLTLLEGLTPLYKLQWARQKQGLTAPPRGNQVFVKLETSLARFMKLGQRELDEFLNTHSEDALSILSKLIQWLSGGNITPEALKILSGIDPSKLPAVTSLLGLSNLKAAHQEWEANRDNDSEDFWQELLAKHSFVLSQLFAHPVVVIADKAYLGGKGIDNKGGSLLDFLMASESTDSIALVEIKTPDTDLLGTAYRTDVYPVSTAINGAVAQVLKYRRTFASRFDSLTRGDDLNMGAMRCLVVAGDTRELDSAEKQEAFDSYRDQLMDVDIITYDELFSKLATSIRLLEGLTDSAQQETAPE